MRKDIAKIFQTNIDNPIQYKNEIFQKDNLPDPLNLSAASDEMWATLFHQEMIPTLEAVYLKIKDENQTTYGDTTVSTHDDPLNEKRRILTYDYRNHKFLFIWNEMNSHFYDFHIRRYYSDIIDEDFKSEVEHDGINSAITLADDLIEYSDCLDKNLHPTRYSLDKFKQDKFKVKYGDIRDAGYVTSFNSSTFDMYVKNSIIKFQQLDYIYSVLIPEMKSCILDE